MLDPPLARRRRTRSNDRSPISRVSRRARGRTTPASRSEVCGPGGPGVEPSCAARRMTDPPTVARHLLLRRRARCARRHSPPRVRLPAGAPADLPASDRSPRGTPPDRRPQRCQNGRGSPHIGAAQVCAAWRASRADTRRGHRIPGTIRLRRFGVVTVPSPVRRDRESSPASAAAAITARSAVVRRGGRDGEDSHDRRQAARLWLSCRMYRVKLWSFELCRSTAIESHSVCDGRGPGGAARPRHGRHLRHVDPRRLPAWLSDSRSSPPTCSGTGSRVNHGAASTRSVRMPMCSATFWTCSGTSAPPSLANHLGVAWPCRCPTSFPSAASVSCW